MNSPSTGIPGRVVYFGMRTAEAAGGTVAGMTLGAGMSTPL